MLRRFGCVLIFLYLKMSCRSASVLVAGRVIYRAFRFLGFCLSDTRATVLSSTVPQFDFGLARVVKRRNRVNARYEMTGETGSMRYMAPEVREFSRCTCFNIVVNTVVCVTVSAVLSSTVHVHCCRKVQILLHTTGIQQSLRRQLKVDVSS